MSASKNITLKKGITGTFVCRIERLSICNKPVQIAGVTATCVWYADHEEKDANRPLVEPMSFDLPIAAFVGVTGEDDAVALAYIELSKPGMMLEGSVFC